MAISILVDERQIQSHMAERIACGIAFALAAYLGITCSEIIRLIATQEQHVTPHTQRDVSQKTVEINTENSEAKPEDVVTTDFTLGEKKGGSADDTEEITTIDPPKPKPSVLRPRLFVALGAVLLAVILVAVFNLIPQDNTDGLELSATEPDTGPLVDRMTNDEFQAIAPTFSDNVTEGKHLADLLHDSNYARAEVCGIGFYKSTPCITFAVQVFDTCEFTATFTDVKQDGTNGVFGDHISEVTKLGDGFSWLALNFYSSELTHDSDGPHGVSGKLVLTNADTGEIIMAAPFRID